MRLPEKLNIEPVRNLQLALMDKYADHHINKMKDNGASPAEIDQKTSECDDTHQNPDRRCDAGDSTLGGGYVGQTGQGDC